LRTPTGLNSPATKNAAHFSLRASNRATQVLAPIAKVDIATLSGVRSLVNLGALVYRRVSSEEQTMFPYRVVAIILFIALGSDSDRLTAGPPADTNDLSLEIAALRAIHQFEFTPAQLKALRKIAADAPADDGGRQQARTSEEFRQALVDLHAALLKGNDERIDERQDKVDTLQESELPELDDGIEITDQAKKNVAKVLRLLSPRQVAAHIAAYGDELPEPLEHFMAAADKARGLDDKEWQHLRDEVADEVGRLAAGLDVEKADEIHNQVVQLLIQVRAQSDDEFKKHRPELEKSIRRILGDLGPFDVLHRLVERALAELLSNPRLLAVLDERIGKQ
jgi:hypothetical protein